ncbi:hypothetical protein HNQ36_005079 [Afipia massiliensis]|uniref:Uncharacterized protein n=1 Tax=Afipia massiliensis TaxID=211460 RepID=A0A840NBE3_9BRAD|nr:hypothetical protein [Afipia massiliensis]MBB5055068.1 hypothetical protein [Afipia massiliensis]
MKLLIHPFLEEIARWLDAEYSETDHEWERYPLAVRLHSILELVGREIATKDVSMTTMRWLPTAGVLYLVGFGISEECLELEMEDTNVIDIPGLHHPGLFNLMEHAFNKTAVAFKSYAAGYVVVDGRDPDGLRRWKLTASGQRLGGAG